METATKLKREEQRTNSGMMVVAWRRTQRMSGMQENERERDRESEQTSRMRYQQHLNNRQDQTSTKSTEPTNIFSVSLAFFIIFFGRWNVFLFECAPHPLWADYKSWTHPIYIVYANQVCLPIRLTFFQHKNTYHSIHTTYPPRTFNFFHDIFINPPPSTHQLTVRRRQDKEEGRAIWPKIRNYWTTKSNFNR